MDFDVTKISARFLKPVHAAAYCDCSASYLEKLRAERRGPAYCQPEGKKSIRYNVKDLDAWMERYKVQTVDSINLA